MTDDQPMSALGQKQTFAPQKSDVRFTPNSDRKSGFPRKVMSALPPKADMCSAIVSGDGAKQFTVELENVGALGPAQPHGVLSHCVKNGLEIERRATNDLEEFCSRGLLFPCFVKLPSKPSNRTLIRARGSPETLNRITARHFRSDYSTMATHRRPRDAQDSRS
jgi:hypothetical protein